MRLALVAREVYPLTPGGIGTYVAATARLLSTIADVTILTTSVFRPTYDRLLAEGDTRLPPGDVRFAFVEEPTQEEADAWYDRVHCYGARVLERLRELYPDRGPDIIEFPDYLGEGFVTVQAAQGFDPLLQDSCVCVRLHTSIELCRILNARYPRDLCSQTQFEMERYSLARADRLIWQGGDVLGTYQRFYGENALAPAVRIRAPYCGPSVTSEADREYHISSPCRFLCLGRLERRKGVQNLVRAATSLARDDFHVTLVGGDTPTAPLDVSVRGLLELEIADDTRIELRDAVEAAEVADFVRGHDVVVFPSLWECWPYAALEALHLNRPLLATPVGGLGELVEPGVSGWLAAGRDAPALQEAMETVLRGKEQLEAVIRDRAPSAHARTLTDERGILAGYEQLARVKPRRKRAAGREKEPPLVSAIVPYYQSARFVSDTIDSLVRQRYPCMEIIIVDDGSFDEDDWVLAELSARLPVIVVSQVNSGLGAARNFGVLQSRGRYVFPLDADNVADPEFVARCVEILERRPDVAYVTSWSRYIDAGGALRAGPRLGYQPLGNYTSLVARENVAGDAAALIRRQIFDAGYRYSEDLTSFEDWHFYRELHRSGYVGAVIPERLIYYRVREDSMQAQIAQPRRARLEGEIEALLRENAMQWNSSSD